MFEKNIAQPAQSICKITPVSEVRHGDSPVIKTKEVNGRNVYGQFSWIKNFC